VRAKGRLSLCAFEQIKKILLLGQGDLVRAQGNLGNATTCYHERLAIGRAIGDRRRIAWGQHRLDELALERAVEAFAEGLAEALVIAAQTHVS
jgi:hypothetical protein